MVNYCASRHDEAVAAANAQFPVTNAGIQALYEQQIQAANDLHAAALPGINSRITSLQLSLLVDWAQRAKACTDGLQAP